MQVKITGHHVEVTEALRNYCEEKMVRINHHFDQAFDYSSYVLTAKANAAIQFALGRLK